MPISRRHFLGALAAPLAAGSPDEHLRLALDSRNIEHTENLQLTPGPIRKEPRNPLFGEEHPWEARFDNLSPNILLDPADGLYKCWYSPFIVDERTTSTPRARRATQNYIATRPNRRAMGVCYATSRDGLSWQKPSLGLVDFNGSRANNLVARRQAEAGVFRDSHDTDPARRYKMITNALPPQGGDAGRAMAVRFSPDGVHWTEPIPCPEIASPGDTHNNALWAPDLGQYVLFTRLRARVPGIEMPEGTSEDAGNRLAGDIRLVGRAESPDFVHWTRAVEVLRGLEPTRQTYAMPVFRYANLYLGLAAIFHTETDTVDCELTWSPDTVRWERLAPGTPLIPRGPWPSPDCGCIFPAATPVVTGNALRLYYLGANGHHTSWREGTLNLAHLGLDRFAGYRTSPGCACPGRLRTRPMHLSGRALRITADCAGGELRATLLAPDGSVRARSKPVRADVTRTALDWEAGAQFDTTPVQVEFELKGAALYAWSWSADPPR